MEQQTDLATRPETSLERVKNYILSTEIKERFSEMMGRQGIYYLNQVMILVANSKDLQACEPKSILIAAMRAASLRLSVDPAQGQAWIIPYKGVATFQLGYKGVYELALRTNLYRVINVVDVYEGETLTEDRMSGLHTLKGMRTSEKVVGRLLYFKLLSGFEKTFYMTVQEIDAHARHYSQGYNSPKSKWHDPLERPKMERKTVLVNGLRRWGRFNEADAEIINEIEAEQGYIDRSELPNEDEVTPPAVTETHTEAENMAALGFAPDNGPEIDTAHDALAPDPWMLTEDIVPVPYTTLDSKELAGRLNSILKHKPLTGYDQQRIDYIRSILTERAGLKK